MIVGTDGNSGLVIKDEKDVNSIIVVSTAKQYSIQCEYKRISTLEKPMRATTIRMEDTVLERVDSMAKSINRSRTWLINQAVEQFLSYEEWFVQEVQAGVNEVANGELASQGKVEQRFAKWDVSAD